MVNLVQDGNPSQTEGSWNRVEAAREHSVATRYPCDAENGASQNAKAKNRFPTICTASRIVNAGRREVGRQNLLIEYNRHRPDKSEEGAKTLVAALGH